MGTQGPILAITEAREAITELAIRIGEMLHESPHDPVLRRTVREAIIIAGSAQLATDFDALSKATKEVSLLLRHAQGRSMMRANIASWSSSPIEQAEIVFAEARLNRPSRSRSDRDDEEYRDV